MAYDYEIRGFDELARKMESAAAQVPARERRMVVAGARVFKREIETRAPVLDAKTAGSNSLEPGALKADIRVAVLKDVEPVTAIVGPGKKTRHVAGLVEFGHRMVTGGQSKVLAGGETRGPGKAGEVDVESHPFIRPAFEAVQGAAEDAMITDFNKPMEGLN